MTPPLKSPISHPQAGTDVLVTQTPRPQVLERCVWLEPRWGCRGDQDVTVPAALQRPYNLPPPPPPCCWGALFPHKLHLLEGESQRGWLIELCV